MKIYTKTGDQGKTSLFNGQRVSKAHLRVQAYGTVDELNSCLGILHSAVKLKDLKELLTVVQNELFDLGADLATPAGKTGGKQQQTVPRITTAQVVQLEKWIDRYQEELPPLQHFILPGGCMESGYFHLARSVCRRAERWVTLIKEGEEINLQVLIYLNRLSDLLFVLARVVNHRKKITEPIWVPKKK